MDPADKTFCIYILTNDRHTVLYTGVKSDLRRRVYQHREKLLPGFTARYNVAKLVYYEAGYDAIGAITHEKQIKAGSRQKKIDLINGMNPTGRIYTVAYRACLCGSRLLRFARNDDLCGSSLRGAQRRSNLVPVW